MRLQREYDKKYLFQCVAWIIAMFLMMKYSKGAAFLLVMPMIFFGLLMKKTEMLFFWLLVSVCTLIGNPNLVAKGPIFAYAQRATMVLLGGCMAVQVLGSRKSPIMKPFLLMIVYVLFMIVPSAVGWCPMISFLKLFLFTCIYFAYFGVANKVALSDFVSVRRIRSIMLAVAIIFIFGSVALLPFPAISQLSPEKFMESATATSLFMGMTNQSQCLGPVISSLAVILFADLLFSIKKSDPLYISLLACCPYLVYKTSSRTGMGAFLLGMMFVAYMFVKARGINSKWKSRVTSSLFLLGAIGAIGLMASGTAVKQFALKTQDTGGFKVTTEVVMSSRQALIDRAMYNFEKKPMIGNGFQVVEDLANRGWGFSLLSAPIEKGVWVVAILEEGGVIGMFIFCMVLLVGIFGSIRKKAYMGAGCLFVAALTNLGEFTFFSMSYTGGFIWAMVFVGLALDARRIKEARMARMGMIPQGSMRQV